MPDQYPLRSRLQRVNCRACDEVAEIAGRTAACRNGNTAMASGASARDIQLKMATLSCWRAMFGNQISSNAHQIAAIHGAPTSPFETDHLDDVPGSSSLTAP
jgi:hypothetical protein